MAEPIRLTVNQERCSRCGICVEICPSGIIRMGNEWPEMIQPKACIKCGHCVAVCPQAALDHTRNRLSDQVDVSRFAPVDPETAERFLRSRRSVRTYEPTPVSDDTIRKLLDIARYAPSGGNSQGISYLVLGEAGTLRRITAAVVDWLEEQIRGGAAWVSAYAGMVRIYRETGYDIVLRGAPHLVLALSAANNPIGRDNARYTLAYAELFAPSLGLGSCWAGFFEMAAFSGYPPLMDVLGIPADRSFAGAIMLGVPKFRYQRLVERNPLDIVIR